jgi:hypothetical protein
MSLRPGLLRRTLNLVLIIQCLSRNNIVVFNFTYFVRCSRLPPPLPRCLRLPKVEDHCPNINWREQVTRSLQSIYCQSSLCSVSGHYPSHFYLKPSVSETAFCLRLKVGPTHLDSVGRACPYLLTPVPTQGKTCWAQLSRFHLKSETNCCLRNIMSFI